MAVWNAHNTLFDWKGSAICVTCLRLNDVRVICRVTYFHFLNLSAFLPCRSTRQHSGVLVYQISDIGRCQKFGSVSCTKRTFHGNDYELILMVKMVTRHPTEKVAIFRRSVIIA